MAETAVTVFPFTVAVTSLLKLYSLSGISRTEYTYFFPLSNAVMVGKVLYIPSLECHMATGSSFSFNSCQYSSAIRYLP